MGNYWEAKKLQRNNTELHKNQLRSRFAEIINIYEATENDNSFFLVDIRLTTGGTFQDLPYDGTYGYDYETENIHGLFIPPRLGQIVKINFYNGRGDAPYIISCSAMANNSNNSGKVKKYQQQLKKDEIFLSHFIGSKLSLNKDGEILLNNINGNKVDLNKDGEIVLQSNDENLPIEKMILGETLKDKLDSLIDLFSDTLTAIQSLTVICAAPASPSSPPVNIADFISQSAQLSTLKTELIEILSSKNRNN